MTTDDVLRAGSTRRRAFVAVTAPRAARLLGALAVATLTALASGCGDDDDNPMDPDANEPDRSTPQALLETFFETAYASQNAALYGAMLDDDFRFEFLAEDADSVRAALGPGVVGSDDSWDRASDVLSTEAMFADSSVTGITLNLQVNSSAAMPDTLGCVECQRLEATVTLRVATVGDGTEPLIFTVDSPQTFIAKKDEADSTRWVLWRQFDRPRSTPLAFGSNRATQSSSWGQIKGLYVPGPNPPRPRRDTPALLLTDFFEAAYSRQDSALYAEMLDPEFHFEFLQQDADSLRDVLGSDNFWGKTLDLRSTGALFRAESVTGVTLNLQVNANDPYVGSDCVGCRAIETTVTLRVATIGDGTEPLIFAIDSPQSFVVKREAATSWWTVFRQIDRPRSISRMASAGSSIATESKSWGEIKGLFR